jgi:hypothetical protein
LRVNPDGKCYGYRPAPDADFKWLTYKEVDKKIKCHTAALISVGMEEVSILQIIKLLIQ